MQCESHAYTPLQNQHNLYPLWYVYGCISLIYVTLEVTWMSFQSICSIIHDWYLVSILEVSVPLPPTENKEIRSLAPYRISFSLFKMRISLRAPVNVFVHVQANAIKEMSSGSSFCIKSICSVKCDCFILRVQTDHIFSLHACNHTRTYTQDLMIRNWLEFSIDFLIILSISSDQWQPDMLSISRTNWH